MYNLYIGGWDKRGDGGGRGGWVKRCGEGNEEGVKKRRGKIRGGGFRPITHTPHPL